MHNPKFYTLNFQYKSDELLSILRDLRDNSIETNSQLRLINERLKDVPTYLSMIVDNTNCACEQLKNLGNSELDAFYLNVNGERVNNKNLGTQPNRGPLEDDSLIRLTFDIVSKVDGNFREYKLKEATKGILIFKETDIQENKVTITIGFNQNYSRDLRLVLEQEGTNKQIEFVAIQQGYLERMEIIVNHSTPKNYTFQVGKLDDNTLLLKRLCGFIPDQANSPIDLIIGDKKFVGRVSDMDFSIEMKSVDTKIYLGWGDAVMMYSVTSSDPQPHIKEVLFREHLKFNHFDCQGSSIEKISGKLNITEVSGNFIDSSFRYSKLKDLTGFSFYSRKTKTYRWSFANTTSLLEMFEPFNTDSLADQFKGIWSNSNLKSLNGSLINTHVKYYYDVFAYCDSLVNDNDINPFYTGSYEIMGCFKACKNLGKNHDFAGFDKLENISSLYLDCGTMNVEYPTWEQVGAFYHVGAYENVINTNPNTTIPSDWKNP